MGTNLRESMIDGRFISVAAHCSHKDYIILLTMEKFLVPPKRREIFHFLIWVDLKPTRAVYVC